MKHLFGAKFRWVFLLFSSIIISSANAQQNSNESPDIFFKIESLVKEFYPKAKINRTDKKIHFEFKSRNLSSTSGKQELSPDSGGIVGNLALETGPYTGRERVPSETNLILHMVEVLAPYSQSRNEHLLARLSYPPDAPIEFLSRFKLIVNEIEKGNVEQKLEAKADTEQKEKKSEAEISKATQTEETEKKTTVENKVSFGSKKLSLYSYPEGRFKILLPGNPQMKYGNQLGMRAVDYNYSEASGLYAISYIIAPGKILPQRTEPLFDSLCTSLAKSTKSKELKRYSTSLQGYPGRQVEFANADGKDQIAKFRIFVAGRFVYVLGVIGKKAWTETPVVAEYINSLQINPEVSPFEQQRQKSFSVGKLPPSKFSIDSSKFQADFKTRSEQMRSEHRRHMEKIQSDLKYNRF